MTQTRNPHFHKPDPYDGGREECIAETVKPDEAVVDALVRGIREETKVADFVLAKPADLVRTHLDEAPVLVVGMPPICWTDAVLHRRAVRGPTFLVEVDNNFHPSYADGPYEEDVACTWWEPRLLRYVLTEYSKVFVGYHRPSLIAAAAFFQSRQ
ncbi:MAG: hypothetical protein HYS74_00690 [Parcubacteria group bacterium]|nr:hypothetical protein [Parcubacteria group bacterium]